MGWEQVKQLIRELLLSRNLADPRIRLNALESIDKLLDIQAPEIKINPETIRNYSKPELTEVLSASKSNGKLNAAELSVLNTIYQVVEGDHAIHASPPQHGRNSAITTSRTNVVREPDDEDYVIGLCDEALGLVATRQHTFAFLRGDARPGKIGRQLPLDAYYHSLQLVIEYRERQHTEAVHFFDKPDCLTVSGVHRGEQRSLYDQRRRETLPKHGIELVEFSYDDFPHQSNKRLRRKKLDDIAVIRQKLAKWIRQS